VVFTAEGALAHPYSVTTGAVRIHTDRVDMVLEVMVEDIFVFQNLKLDESAKEDRLSIEDLLRGAEKHKKYIRENVFLTGPDDRPLPFLIYRMDPDEWDPAGIPVWEFMDYKLTYHLRCPLARPLDALKIRHTFAGDRKAYDSVIILDLVWEGRKPLREHILEKGKTGSFVRKTQPLLGTDSEDPMGPGGGENREDPLGLTSYGSIRTFLYIETSEVRHEILVPLATLETWVEIERREPWVLEVDEQERARERIFRFFRDHLPVVVDSVPVKPLLTRLDFYGLDFKDFAGRVDARPVKTYAARVGVILSYSTKGAPGRVRVTWDLFSPFVKRVRSVVFTDRDHRSWEFTEASKDFEWVRPGGEPPSAPAILMVESERPRRLSVPVVTALGVLSVLLLAGWKRSALWKSKAGLAALILLAASIACWPVARVDVTDPRGPPPKPLDETRMRHAFETLHRNIYRAFDHRDESVVYDVLALSLYGDLLADLYLQVKRGLEMKEQGGIVSRAGEVTMETCAVEPSGAPEAGIPAGFEARATWIVTGTVEHWGHVHARTNRYSATFAVEPRSGAWKITSMDGLEQTRVKFETLLREGM
jgi:hypothetical protein